MKENEGNVSFDIKETFHEEAGQVILSYTQDVEPIAEAIKGGQTRRWLSPEREMKAVAEIPVVILMDYAKSRGMSYGALLMDDVEIRRFLSDPANSLWRL